MVIAASGCGKGKDANVDATANHTSSSASENNSTAETDKPSQTSTGEGAVTEPGTDNNGNGSEEKPQLLQSANVDLDADGVNEEVEVLSLKTGGKGGDDPGELEGILRIIDGNKVTDTTFIKKQAGFNGVMTSIEFADLDGDGAKDVFIIIPESGAAFSLNYYYAYSYKTGKAYSFTIDSSLSEFTSGFAFKYMGKGKLEIENSALSFKAAFDISDSPGIEKDDESNKDYENSWVEPTPVEIGENSRISLVKENGGAVAIKVPLPVFGRATADMIGQIDLYYAMGKDFIPALRSFEVLDFSSEGHKSIGKWTKG